jgi:two-component system, chemotaxis family, protein-glutamate methylesterase/glutaminase
MSVEYRMNISSLILIGASTGGPGRIYSILSALEKEYEGTIVIAQHMSASFIPSFIHQLQSIVPLPILSVEHPIELQKGSIYICSITSRLRYKHHAVWIEPATNEEFPYNPQIDMLFSTAAELPTTLKRLGVVLTGIGDDGANGSLKLKKSGGDCIFESEKSAVVYGMPRRAKELVEDGYVADIGEIVQKIKEFGGLSVRMV